MSRQLGTFYCENDGWDKRDNGTLVKDLMEQNGILKDEIDRLNKMITDQSEMIGKQLKKDIEIQAKGKFNNAGEIVQPTALSHNVREIFDNEWRNVMTTYFRGDKELEGIQILSKLLQDCQLFCQEKAREQLVDFVNPFSENKQCDVEEIIQSKEEQHNLYKLRRIIGLHDRNKLNVTKLFAKGCREKEQYRYIKDFFDNGQYLETTEEHDDGKCLKTRQDVIENGECLENRITDKGKDSNAKHDVANSCEVIGDAAVIKQVNYLNCKEEISCIEEYITKCCDICWQCAISDPPVFLKFDVIGENIERISDKFQEYHYKGATVDETGVSNVVMQVVWPAVVIHNEGENTDILVDNAKGSVLLYKSSAV